MNEVISVIASSIAIAKLVRDLQRKCGAIRDAPKEVQSLLDDSNYLNNVLSAIAQQLNEINSYVLANAKWSSCHLFCRQTAEELNNLLTKVSQDINKHRWRSSVQFAFYNEGISRRRKDSEKAKPTLMLAQQSLNTYVQIAIERAEHGNQIAKRYPLPNCAAKCRMYQHQ